MIRSCNAEMLLTNNIVAQVSDISNVTVILAFWINQSLDLTGVPPLIRVPDWVADPNYFGLGSILLAYSFGPW